MDHYNEQLVRKQSEPKDMALRALIIFLTLAVIFLTVAAAVLFGFLPLVVVAAGACYLAYILMGSTFVEYEYIVTNNDLDIDKITGKRKRKRLVTVRLNTVRDWGEYTGREQVNVNATVMASDAAGYGMWYLVAEHEKHGTILVIFTPSEETVTNINFGVPHGIKKRLADNKKENDTENKNE
ncbi:MAG: hypothetical protein NC394_08780 [Bacteroides sp.]|nr:hypothetical protein [Bacteroides sp.]